MKFLFSLSEINSYLQPLSFGKFLVLFSSLIAQLVKNPLAVQETPVRFLGWEDPLEKG